MVIVLGIVPESPLLGSFLKFKVHGYQISSCVQCIEIMLVQARNDNGLPHQFNKCLADSIVMDVPYTVL